MTTNTSGPSETSEIAILRVPDNLEHDITISRQPSWQHITVCQYDHVKMDVSIQHKSAHFVLTERMIHTQSAIQQMAASDRIGFVSCTHETLTTVTDGHDNRQHATC